MKAILFISLFAIGCSHATKSFDRTISSDNDSSFVELDPNKMNCSLSKSKTGNYFSLLVMYDGQEAFKVGTGNKNYFEGLRLKCLNAIEEAKRDKNSVIFDPNSSPINFEVGEKGVTVKRFKARIDKLEERITILESKTP